jgi:hypothetical protein
MPELFLLRLEGAARVNPGWCRYRIFSALGSGCMAPLARRRQLMVSRSRARRLSGFGGMRWSGGGGLRLRKRWQRSGSGRSKIFELLCVRSGRAMWRPGQGDEVGEGGCSELRSCGRGCESLTCEDVEQLGPIRLCRLRREHGEGCGGRSVSATRPRRAGRRRGVARSHSR